MYRWRIRKNVDFERTARTMIYTFNRKFYDDTDENRFTWSRWFFPVLSTDEGLRELGYRSLVNEYYKAREDAEA